MTPQPGLPDLVFTANAGLVFHDTFLSSRFRHDVRAKESPHFDAWFAANGFQLWNTYRPNTYHEGAGDALFCGETLFAGYRTRSDASAHHWVGERFGVRVLPLELVNPRFYHLDTCFCPLATGRSAVLPRRVRHLRQARAVTRTFRSSSRWRKRRRTASGATRWWSGKTVVHNSRCPQLAAELAHAGYTPVEVELDEFLKAGGSAKCLTLRLDGEEAAGWKRSVQVPD